MADDVKDVKDQPPEEELNPDTTEMSEDSEPVTTVSAEEEMATQTEELSETGGSPEKSAEEIAAEEAMLAMMDKPASDDGDEENNEVTIVNSGSRNLDLLMDVDLQVTVELGRKDMKFNEILQLGKGSLVELNKIADEPVEIYVNQSKIAEGEVVVVDDHFGVRITRLINDSKIKSSG